MFQNPYSARGARTRRHRAGMWPIPALGPRNSSPSRLARERSRSRDARSTRTGRARGLGLVHRRDGLELEAVEALDGGELRCLDAPLNEAPFTVDELELDQAREKLDVVQALLRRLTRHLSYWRRSVGSLRVLSRRSSRIWGGSLIAHLRTSGTGSSRRGPDLRNAILDDAGTGCGLHLSPDRRRPPRDRRRALARRPQPNARR